MKFRKRLDQSNEVLARFDGADGQKIGSIRIALHAPLSNHWTVLHGFRIEPGSRCEENR
jgi:hypothetical protein